MFSTKTRFYILTLFIVVGVLINDVTSAVISNKNGTESSNEMAKGQTRTSQTIIRPTNIFEIEGDQMIDKERETFPSDREKFRHIRPFEYLHQKLTEYLICVYNEQGGCEAKLAEAMKTSNINEYLWNLKEEPDSLNHMDSATKPADRENDRWRGSDPLLSFSKPEDKFVVMGPDAGNTVGDKPNLLKEPERFDQPRSFGRKGDLGRLGPVRPMPNDRFKNQQRSPMPFRDRMPFGDFNPSGPYNGGPKGRMHAGEDNFDTPWRRQPGSAFPNVPIHFPYGMMGIPFFLPM